MSHLKAQHFQGNNLKQQSSLHISSDNLYGTGFSGIIRVYGIKTLHLL